MKRINKYLCALFLFFISYNVLGQGYSFKLSKNGDINTTTFYGTIYLISGEKYFGLLTYDNKLDVVKINNDTSSFIIHYSQIDYFYKFNKNEIIKYNYHIPLKHNEGYDVFCVVEDGKINILYLYEFEKSNIKSNYLDLLKITYYTFNYETGELTKIFNFKKQIYPLMTDKCLLVDDFIAKNKIKINNKKTPASKLYRVVAYYNELERNNVGAVRLEPTKEDLVTSSD